MISTTRPPSSIWALGSALIQLQTRYSIQLALPHSDLPVPSKSQVRDFAFSPDTGAVAKIVYDDFGLTFLPVTFFDTFSVGMADVLSVSLGSIIVSEEAKYRERKVRIHTHTQSPKIPSKNLHVTYTLRL